MTNKILSIQSHVVHGYVGNRAATFPLQYKGWDVDVLNTVNFSNHPGYGQFTGVKTSVDVINDIYKGLEAIGIVYDCLLTGYTPTHECLDVAGDICVDVCNKNKTLRNKETIWVLDPVLGDNGRLYVSEAVIPVYKKILSCGHVTLTTPNQFEIELLTGVKIVDLVSLRECVTQFHQLYKVPNVVVSSVVFPDDPMIYSVGSSCSSSLTPRIFYYKFSRIESSFSGCGDLFSALLTDSFYRKIAPYSGDKYLDGVDIDDLPLIPALGESLTKMEKVLHISYEDEKRCLKERDEEIPVSLSIKDLRIIQARAVFDEDVNDYNVEFL